MRRAYALSAGVQAAWIALFIFSSMATFVWDVKVRLLGIRPCARSVRVSR